MWLTLTRRTDGEIADAAGQDAFGRRSGELADAAVGTPPDEGAFRLEKQPPSRARARIAHDL